MPPRPWARMDTAIWISTFTGSFHNAEELRPNREVRMAGLSGESPLFSSTIFTWSPRSTATFGEFAQPYDTALFLPPARAGSDTSSHKTIIRQFDSSAPDIQFTLFVPYPYVHARTLHAGRQFAQHLGAERQAFFKQQRLACLGRFQEGQRYFGRVAFFFTEAGPEATSIIFSTIPASGAQARSSSHFL